MSRKARLLIDGKWVDAASGKTFAVYNPATGDVLAQVAEARQGRRRPRRPGRAPRLRRRPVAQDDGVRARPADVEARRPDRAAPGRARRARDRSTTASRSRSRASPTCRSPSTCSATMAAGRPRSTARRSRGRCPTTSTRYTLREPVGVVGQIIPWNFPLLMAAWKLAPGAGGRLHGRAQAGRADAADARCGSAS